MASLRVSLAGLAITSAIFAALPLAAQTRPEYLDADRAVASVPGQYDGAWTGGWVGPEGQVYRGNWQGNYRGPDGRSYPGSYAGQWMPESRGDIRDAAYRGDMGAQRENWLLDCRRRLDVANHARDGMDSYRGVCDAWLGYYERNGWARDGYGFNYAIPVTLVALAPRPFVAMASAPRPHYRIVKQWHPKGHWHSKRVRIIH
ncbi:MAG: hypothetical protein RLY97_1553 [Pseudomonadota bacterium]|jgi:hypothetical protein